MSSTANKPAVITLLTVGSAVTTQFDTVDRAYEFCTYHKIRAVIRVDGIEAYAVTRGGELYPIPGAARPAVAYHRDGSVTVRGFERASEPSSRALDQLAFPAFLRVCKHCGLSPLTGRKLGADEAIV